ncbi:MAG: hypothetical protein AVDCRST_MAG93-9142, partial [uncultured Chloroflexia bacterium]
MARIPFFRAYVLYGSQSLINNTGGFTITDCEQIFPGRSRRMLNRDIKGL